MTAAQDVERPADRNVAPQTLDLEGRRPPDWPSRVLTEPVAARIARPLAGWMHEEARLAGLSTSLWLGRLIERARNDGRPEWPHDVERWLRAQAAQCGCPGDTDRAVVEVVRHLAVRWPDGCRLR